MQIADLERRYALLPEQEFFVNVPPLLSFMNCTDFRRLKAEYVYKRAAMKQNPPLKYTWDDVVRAGFSLCAAFADMSTLREIPFALCTPSSTVMSEVALFWLLGGKKMAQIICEFLSFDPTVIKEWDSDIPLVKQYEFAEVPEHFRRLHDMCQMPMYMSSQFCRDMYTSFNLPIVEIQGRIVWAALVPTMPTVPESSDLVIKHDFVCPQASDIQWLDAQPATLDKDVELMRATIRLTEYPYTHWVFVCNDRSVPLFKKGVNGLSMLAFMKNYSMSGRMEDFNWALVARRIVIFPIDVTVTDFLLTTSDVPVPNSFGVVNPRMGVRSEGPVLKCALAPHKELKLGIPFQKSLRYSSCVYFGAHPEMIIKIHRLLDSQGIPSFAFFYNHLHHEIGVFDLVQAMTRYGKVLVCDLEGYRPEARQKCYDLHIVNADYKGVLSFVSALSLKAFFSSCDWARVAHMVEGQCFWSLFCARKRSPTFVSLGVPFVTTEPLRAIIANRPPGFAHDPEHLAYVAINNREYDPSDKDVKAPYFHDFYGVVDGILLKIWEAEGDIWIMYDCTYKQKLYDPFPDQASAFRPISIPPPRWGKWTYVHYQLQSCNGIPTANMLLAVTEEMLPNNLRYLPTSSALNMPHQEVEQSLTSVTKKLMRTTFSSELVGSVDVPAILGHMFNIVPVRYPQEQFFCVRCKRVYDLERMSPLTTFCHDCSGDG